MALSIEEKRERNRIAASKRYHSLSPEERRARNSSPGVRRSKAKYRSNPKNREMENAYTRKWYQENKARKNHRSRLSKYGLTQDQFDAMLSRQNGLCAICKNPPQRKVRLSSPDGFAIDHCHTTDKVRGLLCESCNKMIGLAKDSSKTLESAIEYLKEAKNANV